MNNFWMGVLATLGADVILVILRKQVKKVSGALSTLFGDRKIPLGKWYTYFMKKDEIMGEVAYVKRTFLFNRYFGSIDYEALGRAYEFEAILKQGFILATYASIDSSIVDLGTFTLEVMKNGEVMKGYYAWIINDRSIGKDHYFWFKKPIEKYLYVGDSEIEGKGVFAKVPIEAERLLGKFIGTRVSSPTRESLTLNNKIIDPTCELKYLNHSCNPNSKFIGDGLFSIRDIEKNEEVTIDYKHTETEIKVGFKCNCKSPNCRKQIGI